jgi:hypothetical protein
VTDVGNCAGGWGGAGGTGGRWEAEARQGMAGVSRGAAEGSQGSPRGSCGTTTGRTGECTTEGRGQPPWGWPGSRGGQGRWRMAGDVAPARAWDDAAAGRDITYVGVY